VNQSKSVEHYHLQIKEWVQIHSDELFSWALFKVSDKHTAEDLVQDTFVAAYQSIETFEGKSQPRTWLFTILNRKIIDFYRKSARSVIERSGSADDSVYEHSDQLFDENDGWKQHQSLNLWEQEGELLDNAQFLGVLKQCMQKLPPNWSRSIQAKYLLEMETKEICQELEITPSNYWQILHRAKLLLKGCLELNWFKQ
jgi:RNA polymerase sigma-70 factor (TIGR02943 family)